jgi:hypothetical protein
MDFQSIALPTELPDQCRKRCNATVFGRSEGTQTYNAGLRESKGFLAGLHFIADDMELPAGVQQKNDAAGLCHLSTFEC